jgi:hypothetical protein
MQERVDARIEWIAAFDLAVQLDRRSQIAHHHRVCGVRRHLLQIGLTDLTSQCIQLSSVSLDPPSQCRNLTRGRCFLLGTL